MDRIECDVCVIGAGSAGLSFAAGASQMGARVVLLEGDRMGGDCLNTGCVPSKALLAAAKTAHRRGEGAALGVAPVPPEVDFAAAQAHVRQVIAAIAPHDSQERFEGLGVQVIRAFGRFLGPDDLAAGGHVIRARRYIIATGSRPLVPPIPGIDKVSALTNETIFDLTEVPEHLIILGAGPIGLEMAQAHRRLGARVTVIEADQALKKEDPEAAALVLDQLRAEGIDLRIGLGAVEVARDPQGVRVILEDRSDVTGSHLLVAVGRRPALEGLDLDRAGVAWTKAGVTVTQGLRSTTNRKVYAIGDAAGQGQFTHQAGYHAGVVIRPILFGLPTKARTDHIPRVTYTDPELAQIGLTEPEARATHGAALTVTEVPFAGNDRAQAEATTHGRVKLMSVKGRPVGVTIVGPQAGDLIGLWALILANRLRLSAVAATVLPYPTLGEVNKRVVGAYFSPKLFDSPLVKTVVRIVQRVLP